MRHGSLGDYKNCETAFPIKGGNAFWCRAMILAWKSQKRPQMGQTAKRQPQIGKGIQGISRDKLNGVPCFHDWPFEISLGAFRGKLKLTTFEKLIQLFNAWACVQVWNPKTNPKSVQNLCNRPKKTKRAILTFYSPRFFFETRFPWPLRIACETYIITAADWKKGRNLQIYSRDQKEGF